QLFSTGAAAMVLKYTPGGGPSSLNIIRGQDQETGEEVVVETSRSEATGSKYLKVKSPWESWTQEERNRVVLAEHLIAPDGEEPVVLTQRAGFYFFKYASEVLAETLEKYQK